MSNTTFSIMSNPDLLITLQAYNYMKLKINDRILEIKDSTRQIDKNELSLLGDKNARVDQLVQAILDETAKRENS